MSSPPSFLTIHAEHQRDAYVIRVEGNLDLTGCPDLDGALAAAERTQARRIILDLEELTFIDSTGLEALLRASHRSASDGNRLELTRGKGYPADMLRLTGLDMTLPLTEAALCPAVRDKGRSAGPIVNWPAA